MNGNARILSFSGFDISKSNLIELLLSRHSSWDGRAVIKTDENSHCGIKLIEIVWRGEAIIYCLRATKRRNFRGAWVV